MERKKGSTLMLDENKRLVLDELYFVTTFEELCENTELEERTLSLILKELWKDGLVKQMKFSGKGYTSLKIFSQEKIKKTSFLATKKGLMTHHNVND